jgi:hypothetical protein
MADAEEGVAPMEVDGDATRATKKSPAGEHSTAADREEDLEIDDDALEEGSPEKEEIQVPLKKRGGKALQERLKAEGEPVKGAEGAKKKDKGAAAKVEPEPVQEEEGDDDEEGESEEEEEEEEEEDEDSKSIKDMPSEERKRLQEIVWAKSRSWPYYWPAFIYWPS